jgi:hypothetical protein
MVLPAGALDLIVGVCPVAEADRVPRPFMKCLPEEARTGPSCK